MNAFKSYIAEFIGTMVLMIGGVGTAVLAGEHVGFLGIAFAFGLTLLFLVYAIGPISGCHVNPAVTAGLAVTGKIAIKDAIAYVIAQVLGGIAGAAIVLGIASGNPAYSRAMDGVGANGYDAMSPDGYSMTSVFGVEVVLTAVFIFVILSATDRLGNAALAGLAIGTTLAVIHMIAIPVSGTSVNPARSLGSAIFTDGALSQVWIFWVAPILGAVIGGLIYHLVFTIGREDEPAMLNVDGRADGDPLDRSPQTAGDRTHYRPDPLP